LRQCSRSKACGKPFDGCIGCVMPKVLAQRTRLFSMRCDGSIKVVAS
jgi:hypothetical protein